jgi:hypothetical protein
MSHGVGFAGSAATARRLALPSFDMTVICQAEGRAVGQVVDPLERNGSPGSSPGRTARLILDAGCSLMPVAF